MSDITRYLGEPVYRIGNTVKVYTCPCCNKPSLKVNIASPTKPYACWSGGCSKEDIRKSLRLTVQKSEIIRPASYNIQPIKLETIEPLFVSDYIPPITVRHNVTHDNKLANVTTYRYSDTHQVERIDFHDGSKKKFLPSYFKDNKRIYGADYNCPLFNEYLLVGKKTVYVVEGEKCAVEFTRELGMLAVSPPGFGWTEKFLRPKLQSLSSKVSGLVIVPDKDKAGLLKAQTLRTIAWSVGLPCRIINLPNAAQGEDIVDLLARNVDVLPYLK